MITDLVDSSVGAMEASHRSGELFARDLRGHSAVMESGRSEAAEEQSRAIAVGADQLAALSRANLDSGKAAIKVGVGGRSV